MSKKSYPRVLHAVESIELGKWPLVDALLAEIETTDGGSAGNNEYERVVDYLVKNDQADYTAQYIRDLFQLGRWVAIHDARSEFRSYPVSLVRVARLAAKRDHDRALAILQEKSSFRAIEGRPSERRPKTPLDKLGKATTLAWEVQELFREGYEPTSDTERFWLASLAERLQQFADIIERLSRGTAVPNAEISKADLDDFFAQINEFTAAS